MSAYFCGNPFNHPPHAKDGMECEGVDREEVKETIVEKFDPRVEGALTELKEQPTDKVTIFIEGHDGKSVVVVIPKASHFESEVRYIAERPVDPFYRSTRERPTPQIERMMFEFKPEHDPTSGIAYTVINVEETEGAQYTLYAEQLMLDVAKLFDEAIEASMDIEGPRYDPSIAAYEMNFTLVELAQKLIEERNKNALP